MRKDMARKIIEGGRYRGDRKETLYSNDHWSFAQMRDVDDYDDRPIKSKHRYRRDPRDTTNPLSRWLLSKVGKPWNEVYSEFREVAGHHNVAAKHLLDHMRFEVEMPNAPSHWFGSTRDKLYVDDEGILRIKKTKYTKSRGKNRPEVTRIEVNGNVFRLIGGKWYFVTVKARKVKKYGDWDSWSNLHVYKWKLSGAYNQREPDIVEEIVSKRLADEQEFKHWLKPRLPESQWAM